MKSICFLFRYNLSFTGDIISVDVPKAERDEHVGSFIFSTKMARKMWNQEEESLSFKVSIVKSEIK